MESVLNHEADHKAQATELIAFLPGLHHVEIAQALKIEPAAAEALCQELGHQPEYMGYPAPNRFKVTKYLIDCHRGGLCPSFIEIAKEVDISHRSTQYHCLRLGYESPLAVGKRNSDVKSKLNELYGGLKEPPNYKQRQIQLAKLGIEASLSKIMEASEQIGLPSPKATFNFEVLAKTTHSLGEIALEFSAQVAQAEKLVALLPNLHPAEVGDILSLDWGIAQAICQQINHRPSRITIPSETQRSVATYLGRALLDGQQPTYEEIFSQTEATIYSKSIQRICSRLGYESPRALGKTMTKNQLVIKKIITKTKERLSLSQIQARAKEEGVCVSERTISGICDSLNYTTRQSRQADQYKDLNHDQEIDTSSNEYKQSLQETKQLLDALPSLHPVEVSAITRQNLDLIEACFRDLGQPFDLCNQPTRQGQKISLYLGERTLANQDIPSQLSLAKELGLQQSTVSSHFKRLGFVNR